MGAVVIIRILSPELSGTSWPPFVAGFLAFGAVALVANTTVGDHVDEWIAERKVGGKAILLGFVVAAVVVSFDTVPDGVSSGGLAGFVLDLLAGLVLDGEVSGWLPPDA